MRDVRRTFAGRYRIEDTIASGGMATVYLATDEALHRPVAVKVLAQQYAGDEHFVERFRREGRAAAALNDPHIVAVFDADSEDGIEFIVMEYVQGRTLADRLREEGPLPEDEAVRVAAAVCQALAVAHDRGIVHRDIKPANILLASDGHVKVADFGIARLDDGVALTRTATILGTALYLSPEQAEGRAAEPRSDLYSLGCVLYEALAGRPPFHAQTAVAVAYAHAHQSPQPLGTIRQVSPSLESVVARAMAKRPADRFADARAMRGAVLAAIGQTSAPTAPLERHPTEQLPHVARTRMPAVLRRRLPGRLVAAVVCAVAILLALAILPPVTPDTSTSSERRTEAARQTPAPTATPAQSPVPVSQTPSERLAALILDGIRSGQIDPETARELTKRAEEMLDPRGGPGKGKGRGRADDLREWIAGQTKDGHIAPVRAALILDALTQLAPTRASDGDDDD